MQRRSEHTPNALSESRGHVEGPHQKGIKAAHVNERSPIVPSFVASSGGEESLPYPTEDEAARRKHKKKRKTTDFMGRTCVEPSYQPEVRPNLATVVFPGFLASFAQASKYTGPDPVVMLDKADRSKVVARVRCRYSPRVLHNVIPAPDIRENELGWSFNPIGFFSCLKNAGTRWFFRLEGMPMVHTVASLNNMGGYDDQRDCVARIEDALRYIDAEAEENGADMGEKEEEEEDEASNNRKRQERHQNRKQRRKATKKKIVLFGFSRGGATVMHTALKLPEALARRISLVVAEAPFDTFEGVMADSSWFPSLNRCAFKAIANPSHPSAYDFPEKTYLRCPMAFITSNGDTRVPPKTTQRCIDTIRARYPHIKVEHLSLSSARHPTMTYSNAADREAYVSFMERLYDTYVPHEGVSSSFTEEENSLPPAEEDLIAPAFA